jgi:hypothetical protein
MNLNRHHLIEKMNISEQAKYYFDKLKFYEIIEDALVLSTTLHKVNECMENQWSFKVELEYCTENDILVFYHAIIDARRQYLVINNVDIKVFFYTWYDSMSGNFYFSIISQNWKKLSPSQELPFYCAVNKVSNLEDIIQKFVNDPYQGRIPVEELQEVDNESDDEDPENDILDVWCIEL